MNEPKHTPGPWEVQCAPRMTEIWQKPAGRTTSYHVARALAAIHGYGNEDSPPVEQAEANARLIAEAGTVATETGFTPRQLADRCEKLEIDLRCADACLEVLRHAIPKARARIECGDVAGAVSVLNGAFCQTTVSVSRDAVSLGYATSCVSRNAIAKATGRDGEEG